MKLLSFIESIPTHQLDLSLSLLKSLIQIAFSMGAGLALIGWHLDTDAWVNGGMVIMTGAFITGVIAALCAFLLALGLSMKNRYQARQDP